MDKVDSALHSSKHSTIEILICNVVYALLIEIVRFFIKNRKLRFGLERYGLFFATRGLIRPGLPA